MYNDISNQAAKQAAHNTIANKVETLGAAVERAPTEVEMLAARLASIADRLGLQQSRRIDLIQRLCGATPEYKQNEIPQGPGALGQIAVLLCLIERNIEQGFEELAILERIA